MKKAEHPAKDLNMLTLRSPTGTKTSTYSFQSVKSLKKS